MPELQTLPLAAAPQGDEARLLVPCIVKGKVRFGTDIEHKSRARSTPVFLPEVSLDEMVWLRKDPPPAYDTPIDEIIDFLVEVGERLDFDRNPYFAEALDHMVHFSPLDRRVLENAYREVPLSFQREGLIAEVEQSLGSRDVLDGWVARNAHVPSIEVRAVPPRIVHVLAGNAPLVAAFTVVRAALTKGVHLLKLPSNDMFSATAILRTMADVDPNHPTTRSFSACYWAGGETRTESTIYRSQFFDKVVVWGGEAAVKNVVQFTGPGLEMISFDPKVSGSFIGREAFASPDTVREVARLAAADTIAAGQGACASSRFHYVEGTEEEVDSYCEELVRAMGVDTYYGPGQSNLLPPPDVREEVDMLRDLEPAFRVFGKYDGNGVAVRSDEPVSFHPNGKLVNVVRMNDIRDAIRYVSVATQSVGVYPESLREAISDGLANGGVQRIAPLGGVFARGGIAGLPHDAMMPLNRFMRWVFREQCASATT